MLAACTKLTITGEGASDVMSHPAPVFCTARYCWPVLRSRARGKLDGGVVQRLWLEFPAWHKSALELFCFFGLRETVHADLYELACLIGSAAIDGLEFLTG